MVKVLLYGPPSGHCYSRKNCRTGYKFNTQEKSKLLQLTLQIVLHSWYGWGSVAMTHSFAWGALAHLLEVVFLSAAVSFCLQAAGLAGHWAKSEARMRSVYPLHCMSSLHSSNVWTSSHEFCDLFFHMWPSNICKNCGAISA